MHSWSATTADVSTDDPLEINSINSSVFFLQQSTNPSFSLLILFTYSTIYHLNTPCPSGFEINAHWMEWKGKNPVFILPRRRIWSLPNPRKNPIKFPQMWIPIKGLIESRVMPWSDSDLYNENGVARWEMHPTTFNYYDRRHPNITF